MRGALPIEEVQAIIGPLCGALQLAHDQGILHRDLKPANIVAHDFGGGTRVHKIVDFGLVRVQASGVDAAHRGAPVRRHVHLCVAGTDPRRRGGCAVGSVQPGGRDLRAAGGARAVRRIGSGAARERVDDEAVPRAERAAARSSQVGRRGPGPRPGEIAGGSLRVGGPLRPRAPRRRRIGSDHGDARGEARRAVERRTARDLRARRAPRSRPPGQRRVQRDAPRAGAPGRHPPAAPQPRAQLGRGPRAVPPRGADAAGRPPVDHPGARLRRGGGPRLSRHRLHRGAQPARGAEGRRRDAVAAPAAAAGAAHRSRARAAPERRAAVRAQPRDHARRAGGRRRAPDDLDRRHLAGEGSSGDDGDATLRGTALADVELHYVAPELLTGQNADVRSDVFTMGVLAYEMATGDAAVRRRVDARAARRDVEGAAPRIHATRSRRCPSPRPPRS